MPHLDTTSHLACQYGERETAAICDVSIWVNHEGEMGPKRAPKRRPQCGQRGKRGPELSHMHGGAQGGALWKPDCGAQGGGGQWVVEGRLQEPDLFSVRSEETLVPTLGCFIASFRKDAESSVLKVPPLLSCCPVLRRMGERKT
jgi:hypothetical protein